MTTRNPGPLGRAAAVCFAAIILAAVPMFGAFCGAARGWEIVVCDRRDGDGAGDCRVHGFARQS